MSVKVDDKRQCTEIGGIGILFGLKLFVHLLLRRFQINFFAQPTPSQGQVMIADHSRKLRVCHESLEYFTVLWALRNEVSDTHNAILAAEICLFEQLLEFIIATVNVSNYYC